MKALFKRNKDLTDFKMSFLDTEKCTLNTIMKISYLNSINSATLKMMEKSLMTVK